ncbi:ABC transporter permease [Isoptericola chiayiensis]|uniref:ABC transporter permease n=1 Tax=Isoptericola chiayiensis TaxID=579446 RepID=A0ABP8Y5D1_9MICO|nr:ABC transporter permease [Isoptericola chiayiensis]NOW02410.1 putative ABC transport system permease protein [Isoptericola chiayiensis]
MQVEPTWGLGVALVVLVLIAVAASAVGHLREQRRIVLAAGRAVVQLAAVSLVIAAALASLWWSAVVALVMVSVAVLTATRRTDAGHAWPWVALALLTGLVPVLTVVFASGAVPWQGAALVPIAGIVTGGAMTALSLAGRRAFAALRDERGAYEAALSVGIPRREAIRLVVDRHLPEALLPGMDQTRTVGLVTLPGAFIGVMLGGGTPVQAGAAQILVLCGLLAAQTLTVVTVGALVRRGRLLPADLRRELPT